MSIESKISELTAALQENTAAIMGQSAKADTTSKQKKLDASDSTPPPPPKKEQAATESNTPPPPPKKEQAATESNTPPPPPAKSSGMTADLLNELVKKEFVRIGSDREPIDKLFKKYGASGTYSLDPEVFEQFVKDLAEIPSV